MRLPRYLDAGAEQFSRNRNSTPSLGSLRRIAGALLVATLVGCGEGTPVSPPVLTGIRVIPSDAYVVLADSQPFEAWEVYSDGSVKLATEVTWSAQDTRVAITSAGVATPSTLGMFTISAVASGFTAQADLEATDSFSIVLLPDIQNMSSGENGGLPEMLTAEMDWLIANRRAQKISIVIGLGDSVNCASDTPQSLLNAHEAYKKLDDAGIAYVSIMGNHDYDRCGQIGDRSASSYMHYFDTDRFTSRDWFGDSTFPPDSTENFYVLFEVGTRKFIVVALEFAPRDAAVAWAQQVLDEHSDRAAIVATHQYVICGSQPAIRISVNDMGGPGPAYWEFTDLTYNGGEELWQKLIRKNAGIFLVVSGHFPDESAARVDVNDAGRSVAQICTDYQSDGLGGSGRLRKLTYRPLDARIDVESYSPYLDNYLTNAKNQFQLSIP
jgi:hypothetical protein